MYVNLTAAHGHTPRKFLFKMIEFRTGALFSMPAVKLMCMNTTAPIKIMRVTLDAVNEDKNSLYYLIITLNLS